MRNQILAGLFATLIGLSAQANESYYSIYQAPKAGTVDVSFSTLSQDFNYENALFSTATKDFVWNNNATGNLQAEVIRFSYHRGLAENTSLWIGSHFANRKMNFDAANRSYTSAGLGNIEASIKTGITYEPTTLTYGAHLSLSPMAASLPLGRTVTDQSNFESKSGNNFTGYSSLTPFIGLESYVDQVAIGGRASLILNTPVLFAERNGDSFQTAEATYGTALEGFAEMPLSRKLAFGVNAGITQGGTRGEDMIGSNSRFSSQIYSRYDYDKNMTFNLGLAAKAQAFPVIENSTALNIGLQHRL